MSHPPPPSDAGAPADRRFVTTIAVVIVIMVLVLLGLLWVGSRLDTLEDQLGFPTARPPDTPSVGTAIVPDDADRHRVYVPVYSHIYARGGKSHLLETTLSIRNTDEHRAITVTRVDYFDTEGALVQAHLRQPQRLGPLATREFLVPQRDTGGGSGANFIVEWVAEDTAGVSPPIVEAVMVGIEGQRGISFVRAGVPVE